MKRIAFGMLSIAVCLLLAAPSRADRNCLDFDGSNDYVRVTRNEKLYLSDSATFEGWFYTKSYCTYSTPLIHYKKSYGNPDGYYINFYASKFRLLWGNAGTYNVNYFDVSSKSSFPLNTWKHAAVTYRDTTVRFYVDGNLDTTVYLPRHISIIWRYTDAETLALGKLISGSSYYNGRMDRVRIWNYPRTQQQIQENMNYTVAPGTPGLVAQWTLNQGVAGGDNSGVTTVYDSSGAYAGKSSPIDGQLYNFALSGSSSNWLVSNAPSAVELVAFNAFSEPGAVRLRWSTASEQGSAYWLVERSLDAEAGFSEIGRLPAAGSSGIGSNYSFTDDRAQPGQTYYYRIGEMEQGGALTYYGPVSASAGLSASREGRSFSVWPNPFGGTLRLSADPASRVRIYDLTGRMVRDLGGGSECLAWDGKDHTGAAMGQGIYFVRAERKEGTSTCRVTKLR